MLDRPGLRWIIKTRAERMFGAYCGYPVKVSYEGNWVHQHTDGFVVNLNPTPKTLHLMEQTTRDVCFYTYEPRSGDVVVDVGAGIGGETFCLSKCVGDSGRVLAIEAHPRTFDCLHRMVELNNLRNVEVIHAALVEAPKSVLISDDSRHIGNSIMSGGSIEVPGQTLDDIAESMKIDRIDFLKINIEGAETVALAGMSQILRRTRNICVSCHDFKADETGVESFRTKAEVIPMLEQAGFELTCRDDPRPYLRDYIYGINRHLSS